jgi:hypothetical protein
MRKYLTSYVTMNRAERTGLVVLGGTVLLLIGIRYALGMWPAEVVPGNQGNIVALYQHQQDRLQRPRKVLPEHQDASADAIAALPDKVNINEADSVTLVSLKGVGPVTAHKIIGRRVKHPFTEIVQIKEVGSFSHETWAILIRHLTVTSPKHAEGASH